MSWLRLRREVLRLATAAFEAAWFYVAWRLAFALFVANNPGPSYLLVLGLTLSAIFVARYLDLGRPGEARQGWAVAAATGATLLLAAQVVLGGAGRLLVGLRDFDDASLILTLGHLSVWWRALSTVREGFGVERTGLRFRLGVVALFWGLIVAAFIGVNVTPYIFVFFGAALTAMALARVEEVTRDATGVATPFDRTWTAILGGAVAAVMVLGALAFAVLTPDTIRTMLGWLWPLWAALEWVLLAVLYIVAWLLDPLMQALINALRPRLGFLMPTPTPVPTPLPGEGELVPPPPFISPQLAAGLRWVVVAALLGFALWLIGVLAQRRREAEDAPVPELRESVWSADAFGADARALLDRALARLRRSHATHSTESVRRIYASLQALAAERGAPRPPDDTPYEYLPALLALFPTAASELRFLTQAYVDAHYHELPTSEADLARARAAWERLRRLGAAGDGGGEAPR